MLFVRDFTTKLLEKASGHRCLKVFYLELLRIVTTWHEAFCFKFLDM